VKPAGISGIKSWSVRKQNNDLAMHNKHTNVRDLYRRMNGFKKGISLKEA
jgi:hypothetical protein